MKRIMFLMMAVLGAGTILMQASHPAAVAAGAGAEAAGAGAGVENKGYSEKANRVTPEQAFVQIKILYNQTNLSPQNKALFRQYLDDSVTYDAQQLMIINASKTLDVQSIRSLQDELPNGLTALNAIIKRRMNNTLKELHGKAKNFMVVYRDLRNNMKDQDAVSNLVNKIVLQQKLKELIDQEHKSAEDIAESTTKPAGGPAIGGAHDE